jgi:hypothetical protein
MRLVTSSCLHVLLCMRIRPEQTGHIADLRVVTCKSVLAPKRGKPIAASKKCDHDHASSTAYVTYSMNL